MKKRYILLLISSYSFLTYGMCHCCLTDLFNHLFARDWYCFLGAPADAEYAGYLGHLTRPQALAYTRQFLFDHEYLPTFTANITATHHHTYAMVVPANHNPQKHPTNYRYCILIKDLPTHNMVDK